jgi:hypothetical protein
MIMMKIKGSNLEKRKKKQDGAQDKGIIDRAILFYYSRHHRGCKWV